MEEKLEQFNGESPEVICNNCIGNFHQVQVPRTGTLFTPQYYVKWCYFCQTCGKKSKLFCSRIQNNATKTN